MDVFGGFGRRGLWVAATVLLVVFGWWRGPIHDYGAYLLIWEGVLDGEPWGELNTYGPVFLLFAPLAKVWWFLPKLVFIVGFCVGVAVLSERMTPSAGSRCWLRWLPVLLFFGFFPVEVVASFGLNDAGVAALVAFALLARRDGDVVRAGVLLGVAALLKFYPLAFAVLFAVPFGRRDLKVVWSAAGTFCVGMVAAWAATGGGVWNPIRVGGEREPKLLSVFAAFRAHPDVPGAGVFGWLERGPMALVLLVGSVLVVAGLARRFGWSWVEASVVGVAAMLTVYKVGHPQFWLPWLVLVCGVAAESDRGRRLAVACLGWVLFLSVFQFGYWWSDGYWVSWRWVRDGVGFVAPALAMAGPVVWAVQERARSRARTADASMVSNRPVS